jgi:dipeptidyl aminopeptidase/acylaminoacyl peptidase
LLFTDFGQNYSIGGSSPCQGTDDSTTILVLQTPPPSGQNTGPDPSQIYCQNDTFFYDPALSPNGQLVAAEAQSDQGGSSGQIVTFPIGAGVATATAQTPLVSVTPANSGDSLPDFSPDGTQIAFQAPNNTIATVPVSGGTPAPILTDASTPAWSPYTLPSSSGGSSGGTGGGSKGGSGGGSTGGSGGAGAAPVVSVTAPKGQRVLKRKAILVTVSCSAACTAVVKVALTAAHAHKPLARVSKRLTLATAGSQQVAVALSHFVLRKLKAALKHHRRVKAAITVTSGTSSPASTSLTITH